jgi:hypothetical protein
VNCHDPDLCVEGVYSPGLPAQTAIDGTTVASGRTVPGKITA